ncbi:MAG: class GN sortase [Proteobacteria bacterium]|nr:MAG: class GN sortase [Pseudomonadota bacterium]
MMCSSSSRTGRARTITRPGKNRLQWLLLLCAAGFLIQGNFIHLKAILAQHLIESAWSESLTSGDFSPPWSWADWQPVARLEFPEHQQEFFVLSDISGAALAFGPGLHPGGASPEEQGTTIIGGHRDTHFSVLEKIKKGELIRLQNRRGEWKSYRVSSLEVADTETTGLRRVPSAGSHLILITCYPFHSINPGGSLRYIVKADAIQVAAH